MSTIYRLYAWGANSHGQLGLGYKSEQATLPQEINLSLIDLNAENILKIVGGAGHTLMLDKKGVIYSCGWNSRGQTGHRDSEEVLKFRRIKISGLDSEDRVKDVTSGWDSSMALTKNGRVFVWGSNFYGQLGLKEANERLNDPTEIEIGIEKIIFKGISMGLRHSAVVTEVGKIFVTGSGNKCQLGIIGSDRNPVRRLNAFTIIPSLDNVFRVACGQNHTIVVTKTGDMLCWGDNKHGQLGIDNKKFKNISFPHRAASLGCHIEEIFTGWTHASFLDTYGRIFTWGRNTYGQLGYREDAKNLNWTHKQVTITPKIRKLAVGSEHNLAITDDGTILSWGWNEHGNCGNGSTRDVLVPERVEVLGAGKAILVGCGAGHSFAVFAHEI